MSKAMGSTQHHKKNSENEISKYKNKSRKQKIKNIKMKWGDTGLSRLQYHALSWDIPASLSL